MKNMAMVQIFVLGGLLLLAACTRPDDASFYNRGGPESLLDVSSEVVTLNAASPKDLDDLARWVEGDPPTRAELNCAQGLPFCEETSKILELAGVPTNGGATSNQTVTLIYERILARDCDQRYVDNPDNVYNSNHPHFGCSVAANIVQHVTDKQEFISPNISDNPSAVRGVNDMHRAYTPRPVVRPYGVGESLVNKGKTE